MSVDQGFHPVDPPGRGQKVYDVSLSASLCRKLSITPESSHRGQTWDHWPPTTNRIKIIGLSFKINERFTVAGLSAVSWI